MCTVERGVCVVWCVFILLKCNSLPGWRWRSWRPWVSWRAWHCCESCSIHFHLSLSPSCLAQFCPFFAVSHRHFIDRYFICWCLRVLKAMWARRVTLALLAQLGLQDPEEYQGRTDPKATLWVFVSLDQCFFLAVVKSVCLLMHHHVYDSL